MKKAFIVVLVLFAGIAFNASSQTLAPADFFAGKWDILVKGTPDGDAKMVADLVRTNGILSGQLVNVADSSAGKIPVEVSESGNKLGLAFSTQGYDVTIDLEKVDDDNMKGTLMNMFETTAKRMK